MVLTRGRFLRRLQPGRILSPTISSTGHISLQLYVDGSQKCVSVRRLVLTAFVGVCPPGLESCCVDGNVSNNRLENIYWGYNPHDHSTWKRHGRIGACERHHETVKAMAEAGANLGAIGEAVGTTGNRVRAYLTRHGITRPAWCESASLRRRGSLNPAWKGGRHLDADGYVLLLMPDHPEANRHGYVREHRIVMAQMLGRPLTRIEVVDHINRDTGDNRPENLRLFPNNGEHLRVTRTGRPRPEPDRGGKRGTRSHSRECDAMSPGMIDHPPHVPPKPLAS